MANNSQRSRYNRGYVDVKHRGVLVRTTVGSQQYENFLGAPIAGKLGYIPMGYEHRPDRISNLFYGTPDLWWMIMEINNISDPFEGLNVGDQIIISG